MANAKEVFDFIFHWAGVWAVMVYGTVGTVKACHFVRRLAHDRKKKRLFDEAVRRISALSKPNGDEYQTQANEADTIEAR